MGTDPEESSRTGEESTPLLPQPPTRASNPNPLHPGPPRAEQTARLQSPSSRPWSALEAILSLRPTTPGLGALGYGRKQGRVERPKTGAGGRAA